MVSIFVASGAGPDWVSRLRRVTRDDPAVVVVVVDGNPASVRNALATGAEAVVDVGSDVAELEAAVRAAADGRHYADPTLAAAVIAGPGRSDGRSGGLTRRETDVLRLVADGRSNRDIGERLGISVRTVEAHCLHLMRKVGVRARRDLAQFAAAAGIDFSDDT